jgi:translation elongation factor EF-1alpha
MTEQSIGSVAAFYSKISVAAIELTGTLSVGDRIRIKGATTDFEMDITSMQIDHAAVETAGAGQGIGMKVPDRVRPNDQVHKV